MNEIMSTGLYSYRVSWIGVTPAHLTVSVYCETLKAAGELRRALFRNKVRIVAVWAWCGDYWTAVDEREMAPRGFSTRGQ